MYSMPALETHPMTYEEELLGRVVVDSKICRGKPHVRGTRIYLAIILDALSEGLTPREIVNHYPCLEIDDVHAAVAYALRLAEANGGIALIGSAHPNHHFQLR